ncbi:MAG: 2-aminoethylphosphonate--pyruvate transaminase [Rhodospirillales bacterium]|nr:2-aminoethylphosphonate--pyruvate transaminase [Alphaproteobacteria bacterium]MBL6947550.1 2-aminoethylphosphonate--pyruvate transaminase [Rhodospirillales bacterium]
MTQSDQDPWLLTPGPLTTSIETKQAMLHDWGSRDATFIETNRRVLDRLIAIAGGAGSHVCVPVQGSGTFAVEATLGTMIARNDKALVLVNGAYGSRMVKILEYAGRPCVTLETPEDTPPGLDDLDAALKADAAITHVVAVYCETTSGIRNPIEDIARISADNGRALIIDAMSAFGALELDAKNVPFDAMMASSNKCLEGVPGMGYAILRRSALEQCKGNAHALSLDLYDQWMAMEGNGQWRFTPPTHVICAFDAALDQFDAEGGQEGRLQRYSANCKILIDGMRELGFETLLPDDLQAPIIVTFKMPADPAFDFQAFYDALGKRGYLIYPGKLTVAPSFRIGCIGHLGETEMRGALDAIRDTLGEMGVTSGNSGGAPAA